MGFTRRFASRVDSDNQLPGEEGQEEVPTLSARIEEKQKRIDTRSSRPYSSSKVYPQTDDSEIGRAERQRQHNLHAKICIFLCTVLPCVTLVATIHRLWFMGMIEFQDVADCPDEWLVWSGNCYFYMPHPQSWDHALSTCSRLESSNLVDVTTEEENEFLEKMTGSRIWIGGKYSANGWHWEPGGWKINSNKIQHAKKKTGSRTAGVVFPVVQDSSRGTGTRYSDRKRDESTQNGASDALGKGVTSRPLTFPSSTLISSLSLPTSSLSSTLSSKLTSKSSDTHPDVHKTVSADRPAPPPVTGPISGQSTEIIEVPQLHYPNGGHSSSNGNPDQSLPRLSTIQSDPTARTVEQDGQQRLSTVRTAQEDSTVSTVQQDSTVGTVQQDSTDGTVQQNGNIDEKLSTIQSVVLQTGKQAWSRHLDVEECLSFKKGRWIKDECSKKRGFVCKFPLSGRVKREKITCRNKQEVNLYNRNLYYVCQDQ